MLNTTTTTSVPVTTQRYILRLTNPDFVSENTEIDNPIQQNLGQTVGEIVDSNGYLYRQSQLQAQAETFGTELLPISNSDLENNPRNVFEAIRESIVFRPDSEIDSGANDILRDFVRSLNTRYNSGELDITLRNLSDLALSHREELRNVLINPGRILSDNSRRIETDFLNNFFDLFASDLIERLQHMISNMSASSNLRSVLLYIAICLLPALFKFSYFQIFNHRIENATNALVHLIQTRIASSRSIINSVNIRRIAHAFRTRMIQNLEAGRASLIQNLGAVANPNVRRIGTGIFGRLNNFITDMVGAGLARLLRRTFWPTVGFFSVYTVGRILNNPGAFRSRSTILPPAMQVYFGNNLFDEISRQLRDRRPLETIGAVALLRDFIRIVLRRL